MAEYRTKPIERSLLFAELGALCEALSGAGITEAAVSFGWDSNLAIDEMWKDQIVLVQDVYSFVVNAEALGVVMVGTADIFIEAPDFLFTLCHEGDVHVKGNSTLSRQFVHRWEALDYAPFEVQEPA